MLPQYGSSAPFGLKSRSHGRRAIDKDISASQAINRVAGDYNQAPVEAVAFIGGNRPEEKGK